MTSFQEFLKKKAEEQRDDSRRQKREEWVAAVGRLCDQIVTWLKEEDTEQILKIETFKHTKTEEGFGTYDTNGVRVQLGERQAFVSAVARNAVGAVGRHGEIAPRAEGLVEILGEGQRYRIYRVERGGEDAWYFIDKDFVAIPFDKNCFENILLGLFS